MELLSVIVALECLKKIPSHVEIFSDSKYVVDAVEKGWVFNWPGNEEAITVNDNSGNELMVITKDSHSGVASKSNLTQFLFGAPAGRLPQDAIVEQLTIAPLAQDLLIKNNTMPYQWTGTFFFALIMSSLAMKFGLKIQ